ncbi:MAG TPA: metal ABC transporter substrate-binding protein, partial [Candidatus Cloacimonadota bacterium]|nr:metal ABC transporter substrate-binding protein [Candidatus Cloacimonadota bacterium]
EPTPRELARIGSLVKSHRLKAVYTEVQMSDKAARALASEFDLSIVQLDPLGHSFKPKSIMDVILNNWEGLKLGWE